MDRRRPRHLTPPLSPSSPPSSSASRSASRSPSLRRRARLAPSRTRALDSSRLKDSAGLLLGIGIAAVVAHKLWAKGAFHDAKDGDGEARPGHQRRHRSHDADDADGKACDDCRGRGRERVDSFRDAGDGPPRRCRSRCPRKQVRERLSTIAERRRRDEARRELQWRQEERRRPKDPEPVCVKEGYYRRDGTGAYAE